MVEFRLEGDRLEKLEKRVEKLKIVAFWNEVTMDCD